MQSHLPQLIQTSSSSNISKVSVPPGGAEAHHYCSRALLQTDQHYCSSRALLRTAHHCSSRALPHTDQHPPGPIAAVGRRQLLLGTAGLLLSSCWLTTAPRPAHAALAQFPASSLHNRYTLIRAGESNSEAGDAVLTNPVWKTSMTAGLSERGKAQVVRQTVSSLEALGICSDAGCWLWPSITQNAYQTGEIIGGMLGVGRSRIVPEYSFLDARGVGALDGARLGVVSQQLFGGDLQDINWRPPKGYDGTPNESVADVLARMRQLLSITETQFSGEDVVFIAPDSDTLSVLQAAVLGVDMRRHKELGFGPGEVRRLVLSTQSFDTKPLTLPCPRPPSCL